MVMPASSEKRPNRVFHVAFLLFVITYCLAIGTVFAFPPRTNTSAFGRMNAFQAFANVGRMASCGLMNFTLVDWYYAPVVEYDRHIRKSVALLTPVFLAWAVLLSVAAQRVTQVFCRRPDEIC